MWERSVGVLSNIEGPAPADNRKYENCSSIILTYFNDIAVISDIYIYIYIYIYSLNYALNGILP